MAPQAAFITLVFFTALSCVAPAWGYRPFVSTDAAVVDPREVEIELGYFNLERVDEENTFITPKVVLNWGFIRNLEVVGEFEVEKAPDESPQLVVSGAVPEDSPERRDFTREGRDELRSRSRTASACNGCRR